MDLNKEKQGIVTRKPLGRGLDALLGKRLPVNESSSNQGSLQVDGEFKYLSVSQIRASANQPRTIFNQAKLEELARSISEQGLIQPIVVKSLTDGNYEIVAGERRWRAAQIAGLSTIPCIIKDKEDEKFDYAIASIVENLQRENLSPIELARAYDKALKEKGFTQEKLAEKLGISRVSLANTLRLLALPDDAISLVNQRLISEGHARALLALEEKSLISEMAKKALEGGWSVRETEARVKSWKMNAFTKKTSNLPRNAAQDSTKNAQIQGLEGELRQIFGTKVVIKGGVNKGCLEIFYPDSGSLNRIIEKLRKLTNV